MDKQNNFEKSENLVGGGVKSDSSFKENDWYRNRIIEIIGKTENLKYLEIIYKLMLSFKKKWGV